MNTCQAAFLGRISTVVSILLCLQLGGCRSRAAASLTDTGTSEEDQLITARDETWIKDAIAFVTAGQGLRDPKPFRYFKWIGKTRGEFLYSLFKQDEKIYLGQKFTMVFQRSYSDAAFYNNPEGYEDSPSRIFAKGGDYLASLLTLPQKFYESYPSTKTNRHRKRAAAMLRTFFCDDMRPLEVAMQDDAQAMATEHSKGLPDPHLGKPECYTCHFRLDPMGGLFRTVDGRGGVAPGDIIVFSDGDVTGSAAIEAYTAPWKAYGALKKERAWNVGYVQSPTDFTQNSYADNLESFFKEVVSEHPDVKRCIVERTAELAFGSEQLVSGSWLDHISNEFLIDLKGSKMSSSQALEGVFKKILLSKGFSTPTRNPDICYDMSENSYAYDRLGCAEAYVLKHDCIGCHDQRYASGNLDLSRWGPNGFPYTDGRAFDKLSTLEKIQDSIAIRTAGDVPHKTKAMPDNKPFSSRNRKILQDFVYSEIALTKNR